MTSSRTSNRNKRRELLRGIISNFIDIYGCNDTELEKLPMTKLNSINIDTFDFLKWMRREFMETGDNKVFLKKCKMHLESERPVEIEEYRDMNE